MARKFVTLAEAAQQLGITPDEVNELRQRGVLYGYRDGTSWKFKPEDVDRAAEQRTAVPADSDESQEVILLGDSQEISDVPMDLPIDPDVEEDSGEDVVLLSEFELGESGPMPRRRLLAGRASRFRRSRATSSWCRPAIWPKHPARCWAYRGRSKGPARARSGSVARRRKTQPVR